MKSILVYCVRPIARGSGPANYRMGIPRGDSRALHMVDADDGTLEAEGEAKRKQPRAANIKWTSAGQAQRGLQMALFCSGLVCRRSSREGQQSPTTHAGLGVRRFTARPSQIRRGSIEMSRGGRGVCVRGQEGALTVSRGASSAGCWRAGHIVPRSAPRAVRSPHEAACMSTVSVPVPVPVAVS